MRFDNYCESDDEAQCSTVDLSLVSGGGPLTDCFLPHLHGSDTAMRGAIEHLTE